MKFKSVLIEKALFLYGFSRIWGFSQFADCVAPPNGRKALFLYGFSKDFRKNEIKPMVFQGFGENGRPRWDFAKMSPQLSPRVASLWTAGPGGRWPAAVPPAAPPAVPRVASLWTAGPGGRWLAAVPQLSPSCPPAWRACGRLAQEVGGPRAVPPAVPPAVILQRFARQSYEKQCERQSRTLQLKLSRILHRGRTTPNSSVFEHCVNFGCMRLNAFRWGCHFSIRRGPRTMHGRGLLQRNNILDSLSWRVLDCFSHCFS